MLAHLDWGLRLVFMLMFIDLRLVANLGFVRDGMPGLGLAQARPLYLASIVGSLVNLIALPRSGDRAAWLQFHVFGIPFPGLATVPAYGLLIRRPAS